MKIKITLIIVIITSILVIPIFCLNSISATIIGDCVNITSDGGTYFQAADIVPHLTNKQFCILINASNIVLNCNHKFIINFTTHYNAIGIFNANNVTLKDCNVYADFGVNGEYGYYLFNVTNSNFDNLLVQGFDGGFTFWNSSNNSLNGLISNNTGRPIEMRGNSSYNIIKNVTITETPQVGISVGVPDLGECSSYNTFDNIFISNSNLSEETTGIGIGSCSDGNNLSNFNSFNNIGSGITINSNNNFLTNINSSNNTLYGVEITGNNNTLSGNSFNNLFDVYCTAGVINYINNFNYATNSNCTFIDLNPKTPDSGGSSGIIYNTVVITPDNSHSDPIKTILIAIKDNLLLLLILLIIVLIIFKYYKYI